MYGNAFGSIFERELFEALRHRTDGTALDGRYPGLWVWVQFNYLLGTDRLVTCRIM